MPHAPWWIAHSPENHRKRASREVNGLPGHGCSNTSLLAWEGGIWDRVAHPEWNPSKWDPIAECGTDSYEEILVETNVGDQAMQAQTLIQKLKTEQEKLDRQDPDQLPPLLMYMHTAASWRVSHQVLPESVTGCC